MRCVVQRVLSSSVEVGGNIVAQIEKGLNVLVGVENGDTEKDAEYIAEKLFGLRIFEDEEGKTNKNISDLKGKTGNAGIILISQFTLLGDVRHGKRPAFISACEPVLANELYMYLVKLMRDNCEPLGITVGTGVFRAEMKVNIVNDGPFTILLDSRKVF